MIESSNVRLRRNSEEPLRVIKACYGGPEGLETALETHVLAAEGRVRRAEHLCASLPATVGMWRDTVKLLELIAAYGSLGSLGHAEQRVCDALLPLLTRLTKATLRGGFALAEEANGVVVDEVAVALFDPEEILEKTSKAISNCTRGVTCREADCVFEVRLGEKDRCSSSEAQLLSVCFGFADYSESETGAMLWAGAIGLSLFLIEHGRGYLWGHPATHPSVTTPRRHQRIIEIGCGPGLVSLVVSALWERLVAETQGSEERSSLVPAVVELDVTDISPGVVREVRRSFSERCGIARSALGEVTIATEDEHDGVAAEGERAAPLGNGKPALHVHPFCFDFSSIQSDSMRGSYDVVLASDVVYDYAIAQHVAPAIESLLKPGGVALLCCESHRDGMQYFTRHIRDHITTSRLEVALEEKDVQRVLATLVLPNGLTPATCSVMVLRKKSPQPCPSVSATYSATPS